MSNSRFISQNNNSQNKTQRGTARIRLTLADQKPVGTMETGIGRLFEL